MFSPYEIPCLQKIKFPSIRQHITAKAIFHLRPLETQLWFLKKNHTNTLTKKKKKMGKKKLKFQNSSSLHKLNFLIIILWKKISLELYKVSAVLNYKN